jgi:hypothetical protein
MADNDSKIRALYYNWYEDLTVHDTDKYSNQELQSIKQYILDNRGIQGDITRLELDEVNELIAERASEDTIIEQPDFSDFGDWEEPLPLKRGNNMSELKRKQLDPLYKFINDNSERSDQILNAIALSDSTFVIEDYNVYAAELDSLFAVEQDSIANAIKLREIEEAEPGFKQNVHLPDSKIITMFEDLEKWNATSDSLGGPDSTLVQAIKQAKARKAELDPLYAKEVEYEESLMEFPGGAPEDAGWATKAISYPVKAVTGTLMAGVAAVGQIPGLIDDTIANYWREGGEGYGGYVEKMHETSGFPWFVPAEMYRTGLSPEAWGIEGGGDEWPATGGFSTAPKGFSASVLSKEAELDSLQALIIDFKALEREKGWNRSLELKTKANTLQAEIDLLGLTDPRLK